MAVAVGFAADVETDPVEVEDLSVVTLADPARSDHRVRLQRSLDGELDHVLVEEQKPGLIDHVGDLALRSWSCEYQLVSVAFQV